ncbi:LOB domain-containing protein 22-like [Macadamia integrifolia]|uniref:LOB domain-containing protein 22-like n=1 Tax=Macadamia integrifolia TaxID=60698 RepID=UPI001C4EF795|nr:LOB domain-containing protein 22-like [Macadamia integrifolia]
MGSEGGQACAACKHQRRKCHKNCLLAPYFPSTRYQDFMNAHKLFGVSNITKILNQIQPDKRSEAIKSILIESKARKDDPMKGIVGIIDKLRYQIQLCEEELAFVNQKLSHYRQIEQLQSNQELLPFLASSSSSTSAPLLQQLDDHYYYQMTDLYDSDNIESYTTERMEELNQGFTYISTSQENLQENRDVKPLDAKITSRMIDTCQLKREPINFEDGRIS